MNETARRPWQAPRPATCFGGHVRGLWFGALTLVVVACGTASTFDPLATDAGSSDAADGSAMPVKADADTALDAAIDATGIDSSAYDSGASDVDSGSDDAGTVMHDSGVDAAVLYASDYCELLTTRIVAVCDPSITIRCSIDAGAPIVWGCSMSAPNPCATYSTCCVSDGMGGNDCRAHTTHTCSNDGQCNEMPSSSCQFDSLLDGGKDCAEPSGAAN